MLSSSKNEVKESRLSFSTPPLPVVCEKPSKTNSSHLDNLPEPTQPQQLSHVVVGRGQSELEASEQRAEVVVALLLLLAGMALFGLQGDACRRQQQQKEPVQRTLKNTCMVLGLRLLKPRQLTVVNHHV